MENITNSSTNSKHHVYENTSDNTSNQDSKSSTSHTSDNSHKKRKNIKKIIHKIIQPGNSIQIQIKNMKLSEIPAQQTRIYVQAKVGHSKTGIKSSSRIKISENNSVQWDDNMTLNYRLPFNSKDHKFLRRSLSEDCLPTILNNDTYSIANENSLIDYPTSNKSKNNKHHSNNHNHKKNITPNGLIKIRPHLGHEKDKLSTEKHSIKPYQVRFSFRLEDNSGRGHKRYGIAYLNLKKLHVLTNVEFKTTLKYCKYNTIFSCNITIKSNRRSSCGYIEPQRFSTQDRDTYNEPSYSYTSISEKHSANSNSLTKSDKNSDHNDILENNTEGDSENHHEWKLIPSLACSCNDISELPFEINSQKIDFLSSQVDDIIRLAMTN